MSTYAELGPKASLSALLVGIEELAKGLDPELNLYQVMTFLIVATHEGDPLSVSDIGQRAGMASSTASRNLAIMSGFLPRKQGDLRLLVAREDPMERRKKLVALSPVGIKLAEEIGRRVAKKMDVKSRKGER